MNLNQTDTNMEMANQNIRNINELMKLNQRIQAGKELSQEDKDYHEKLQRAEYEDASRNIKEVAEELASRTKSNPSSVSLTIEEEKASNMPGSMPMSF